MQEPISLQNRPVITKQTFSLNIEDYFNHETVFYPNSIA